MKKKAWAIGGLLALAGALPVVIISCSSGEGGGDGTNWNLAGNWNSTVFVTGGMCGILEDETLTAEVIQSGNDVTINVEGGVVYTGSINGDQLNATSESELSPDCIIRADISLAIQSNNQMTGTIQARLIGNGCGFLNGCTDDGDLTANR